MTDYTTRDPAPTTRDPQRGQAFTMCRYCGQRMVRKYDHAAHQSNHGAYCSQGCAEIANPGNGAADAAADANIRRRIAASVDARLPSVIMWLADGETQQEVADRLGVSRQAVSRLTKRLRGSATAIDVCIGTR